MPQKVAIYIRVSTQEQVQEGYSIDAQTDRLKAYCTAKEWLVAGVYTDAGYSGSNTERPALQRLLGDVRAGLIDCVLVYKLDRLSRSQKDTLMLIEDEFLAAGVAFVSMSENFDTSTPLGRAMVGILSVFAQLEREQIRERMSLGRAERAKNGYWHGGGRPPFGYTYSQEDSMLHVVPVEAEIVKEAFDLFLQKKPITTICSHLSQKYGRDIDHNIVHSILSTPIYAGIIAWEGHTYPGRHMAIVDEDTFGRAQHLLNDRRRIAESRPAPFRPKHLLAGLLICGNCGNTYNTKGNYAGHGTKKKYRPYYTCYSRARTNPNKIIDITCRNPTYACVDLDQAVLNEVFRLADDAKAFKSASAKKQKAAATNNAHKKQVIQKRLDELDAQIRRVLDLYQLGSIDVAEIKSRLDELETERRALASQLQTKEQAEKARLTPAAAQTLLSEFSGVVDEGDTVAIRSALRELIDHIVIGTQKGEFDIVWNF